MVFSFSATIRVTVFQGQKGDLGGDCRVSDACCGCAFMAFYLEKMETVPWLTEVGRRGVSCDN